MRLYFRGYPQRAGRIILIVAVLLSSLSLGHLLFIGRLTEISGQLNNYVTSDYSVVYKLNYGCSLENECLFPDMDIQIYNNQERSVRLAVSCVMREDGIPYNLQYLSFLSNLNPDEICVSRNVAKAYRLDIGDVLYAETSYSNDLFPLTIARINDVEYDYTNPDVNNGIGIVFLGTIETYVHSSDPDYLLFSNQSRAEELSRFPQIISTVINKTANEDYVATQGIPALITEALLFLTAIILSHVLFFSASAAILFRCFLKGMKRCFFWIIPFMEKILLCLIPVVVFQFCILVHMPYSCVREAYLIVPVVLCFIYACITLIRDILTVRRKGIKAHGNIVS